MAEETDVIVVGAGLSGLVAATEIADAGKRVIVVDQEGEQSIGGQAFWSFGGLFLVDSPEQRRLGIKDSFDLAMQDWIGAASGPRVSAARMMIANRIGMANASASCQPIPNPSWLIRRTSPSPC